MNKVELLLPAGNIACLRAAVANGADAVYLGMAKFNARQSAKNFDEKNIFSAIKYCHDRNVKVYITFNTLIKNPELDEFFRSMSIAYQAGADAFIIQDKAFIPLIKSNFPKVEIHLSTQAAVMNSYSVPDNVDRVVLARELTIDEISSISKKYRTEVFVHGALCFSYSGLCLFSSITGGRSGNRGRCAQPCRKKYNNKYILSTMDFCLIEKIPELVEAGVASFKIEGRLRSPLYVGTAARIYRRYIDRYYEGKTGVEEKDIDDLLLSYNRGFTQGFAFSDKVLGISNPMNRGLFIGMVRDRKLKLKKPLKKGEGVAIWSGDVVSGFKVAKIFIETGETESASVGDTIHLEKQFNDFDKVFKTSSPDLKVELGDELNIEPFALKNTKIHLPEIKEKHPTPGYKIFAKA
ncbi:U32 family peptidase, partial [Candidatus Woesearchaeota archaeon]|nr:U32 family peptidase [Candidatus Woesearchaeota archaeon]